MTGQKIKIKSYYVQIRNGLPTGVFWNGDKPPEPKYIGDGCIAVHHPESEQEYVPVVCVIERMNGLWYKVEEYKAPEIKPVKKWWEIKWSEIWK